MFDVQTYLTRLGIDGPVRPDLDTLRRVHKGHLLSIAFDNSLNADAERGFEVLGDVRIDDDAVFDAIVTGGRGGVCYELNGLLRRLLTDLGYDVRILGAAVIQVNGEFGPELEHIFNCVHLDGEIWLVDVGLAGPSFLEPLRITDEIQTQYGVDYRLVPEDGYHTLQRRAQGAGWSSVYRFRLQDRSLSEWLTLVPTLDDFPVELQLVGTRIHSRAVDNGQMVLIGRRYVKVEDGKEEIRVLARPEQYREVVDLILTNTGS
ncbi:arylamine N-acetyltransferase [Actinoplanes sp. NPDC023936]|uniref:arylamine N-acetyltransferase family protein n=1 Tax=Actinoplanes sp. NPDC023936 TaxID=3154910 RepID=UPI0033DBD68B